MPGRVGRLCPFSDSVSFNQRVRELVADHAKTLTKRKRAEVKDLKRFHVHIPRHTFAPEWHDAGGSLAELKAVLGHSSVTVTEQYGHIADDLVVREARRLEERRSEAPAC